MAGSIRSPFSKTQQAGKADNPTQAIEAGPLYNQGTAESANRFQGCGSNPAPIDPLPIRRHLLDLRDEVQYLPWIIDQLQMGMRVALRCNPT